MTTIIGTRKLQLFIDDVEYTDSVSSAVLDVQDSDSEFVSFEEALAGGAEDWILKLTIRQDTATDSLWYYAWNEAGEDVSYELWPNGGAPTPSETYPKFSGDLTIMRPRGPMLGGDADKSPKKVQTIEVEWPTTDEPTLTTV